MKLKNKKTGEIKECVVIPIDESGYPNEYQVFEKGDSLTELNEEWEDYEEPKGLGAVGEFGELYEVLGLALNRIEKLKEIGNDFETEEEAEKAVKKLEDWKRLKDKGFRFKGWTIPEKPKTPHIKLVIEAEMDVPDSPHDLDLLFGGEE